MVKRWRCGVLDWVASIAVLALVADLAYTGVTHTPAWWRLAAEVCVMPVAVWLVLRSLTWRVTADADGLRVRTGRRTTRVAWPDVAGASSGPGTSLRIRRAEGCAGKDLVVPSAGLRAPRRAAAEITAMAGDPALRPG